MGKRWAIVLGMLRARHSVRVDNRNVERRARRS
jgi:hypothetical protein